jgi:hypothetical protein
LSIAQPTHFGTGYSEILATTTGCSLTLSATVRSRGCRTDETRDP